jgi:hypothetical protein
LGFCDGHQGCQAAHDPSRLPRRRR